MRKPFLSLLTLSLMSQAFALAAPPARPFPRPLPTAIPIRSGDKDMTTYVKATFKRAGAEIDAFEENDRLAIRSIQFRTPDGRWVSGLGTLRATDREARGFVLGRTSLSGPDVVDYLEVPLIVATTIAVSALVPEVPGAAVALSALISMAWTDMTPPRAGSHADSIIGPELYNTVNFADVAPGKAQVIADYLNNSTSASVPPVGNTELGLALKIVDVADWALSIGRGDYDRSVSATSELVVDQSLDEVVLAFVVDTANGDPVGWTRTSPLTPGGTLTSRDGVVMQSEQPELATPIRNGKSHHWIQRMHIFPKRMMPGRYPVTFSTKETDCTASCLSTIYHVTLIVTPDRRCSLEGLATDPNGGCRTCTLLERYVQGGGGACVSCGHNGHQNFSDNTRCSECTGNTLLHTEFVNWGFGGAVFPSCAACPGMTAVNSARTQCVPFVCKPEVLGQGGRARIGGEKIDDAKCEWIDHDSPAKWTWSCGLDEYLSSSRCVRCAPGEISNPVGQLSGKGAQSCERPGSIPWLVPGNVGNPDAYIASLAPRVQARPAEMAHGGVRGRDAAGTAQYDRWPRRRATVVVEGKSPRTPHVQTFATLVTDEQGAFRYDCSDQARQFAEAGGNLFASSVNFNGARFEGFRFVCKKSCQKNFYLADVPGSAAQCLRCADGSESVGGTVTSCTPLSCPRNFYVSGNVCLPCANGTSPGGSSRSCFITIPGPIRPGPGPGPNPR